MNEEEIDKEILKLKKSLFDEFRFHKPKMNFTMFCQEKLEATKMTNEQIIVASALIDLGIGIGRIMVLMELDYIQAQVQAQKEMPYYEFGG